MGSILRLSDAVSLALHTSIFLAGRPSQLVSVGEMAQSLGVSEAHLSKVLQRLAKVGLVRSVRGPRGGFALTGPAKSVRLLDVYEAIEGPLMSADCLLGKPVCNGRGCILGGLVGTVGRQVRAYLSRTRLSELTGVYGTEGNSEARAGHRRSNRSTRNGRSKPR